MLVTIAFGDEGGRSSEGMRELLAVAGRSSEVARLFVAGRSSAVESEGNRAAIAAFAPRLDSGARGLWVRIVNGGVDDAEEGSMVAVAVAVPLPDADADGGPDAEIDRRNTKLSNPELAPEGEKVGAGPGTSSSSASVPSVSGVGVGVLTRAPAAKPGSVASGGSKLTEREETAELLEELRFEPPLDPPPPPPAEETGRSRALVPRTRGLTAALPPDPLPPLAPAVVAES